ncbi:MAG: asparagine synthase-related protein [Muribaculaceae bacterium]|nr:asparagine synthase-related protein [Muribaculaceae bacterium]
MSIFITVHNKTAQIQADASPTVFNDIEVYVLGDFFTPNGKPATGKDIIDIYSQHRHLAYDHLDGTGEVFIYDRKKEKIYIFTDYFNGTSPVFYAHCHNGLLVSTDLNAITLQLPKRTLSLASAREFMFYAYMRSNRTLIREVKKLGSNHYLEIDVKRSRVRHLKCSYHIPKSGEHIGYESYYQVFKNCLLQSYDPDAAITLSGGFDTNFIMHALNEERASQGFGNTLQAFCGGGVSGKDETQRARQIADQYNNVDMHLFKVGRDAFQNLPHIVYLLQGVSYERGCFMHYELGKLFQRNNVKSVYTGDLADQVFCSETYAYSWKTCKRIVHMDLRGIKYLFKNSFDYYNFPFRSKRDIASHILLKKSGQMWAHFGVKGIYPYMRRPFLSVARSTAIDGNYSKQYHRSAVKHTLPEQVANIIQRNGGNIDTTAMLNEQSRAAIFNVVKDMKWFFNLHFPDIDHQNDFYIKALMIDIFKKIYIDRQLDFKEKTPTLQEMYPSLS